MKVRLIGTDAWGPKTKITIKSLPVIIGRSRSVDVRLADRWASRSHCRLDEVDGQLVLYDLDSTHGTLVNGSHVTEAVISPGDKLTIGMSSFLVHYRPATLHRAGDLPDDSKLLREPVA